MHSLVSRSRGGEGGGGQDSRRLALLNCIYIYILLLSKASYRIGGIIVSLYFPRPFPCSCFSFFQFP